MERKRARERGIEMVREMDSEKDGEREMRRDGEREMERGRNGERERETERGRDGEEEMEREREKDRDDRRHGCEGDTCRLEVNRNTRNNKNKNVKETQTCAELSSIGVLHTSRQARTGERREGGM